MSAGKKVNTSLANKVMDVFLQNNFVDNMGSDSQDQREAALDEALGIMVAVSARMTTAFLLESLRASDNPEEIDELASNIATMFASNFNLALTYELTTSLEKAEAMAEAMNEKITLEKSNPNKPTTH